MSRTFRHIPFWARSIQPWEKTWAGLYPDNPNHRWVWDISRLEHDPRNKLSNGYDNGKGQTYYYTGYPMRGWREQYTKKTRKFFKRNYHKTRRLFDKRLMIKELAGEESPAETIGE